MSSRTRMVDDLIAEHNKHSEPENKKCTAGSMACSLFNRQCVNDASAFCAILGNSDLQALFKMIRLHPKLPPRFEFILSQTLVDKIQEILQTIMWLCFNGDHGTKIANPLKTKKWLGIFQRPIRYVIVHHILDKPQKTPRLQKFLNRDKKTNERPIYLKMKEIHAAVGKLRVGELAVELLLEIIGVLLYVLVVAADVLKRFLHPDLMSLAEKRFVVEGEGKREENSSAFGRFWSSAKEKAFALKEATTGVLATVTGYNKISSKIQKAVVGVVITIEEVIQGLDFMLQQLGFELKLLDGLRLTNPKDTILNKEWIAKFFTMPGEERVTLGSWNCDATNKTWFCENPPGMYTLYAFLGMLHTLDFDATSARFDFKRVYLAAEKLLNKYRKTAAHSHSVGRLQDVHALIYLIPKLVRFQQMMQLAGALAERNIQRLKNERGLLNQAVFGDNISDKHEDERLAILKEEIAKVDVALEEAGDKNQTLQLHLSSANSTENKPQDVAEQQIFTALDFAAAQAFLDVKAQITALIAEKL
jgi:hypothetical protein